MNWLRWIFTGHTQLELEAATLREFAKQAAGSYIPPINGELLELRSRIAAIEKSHAELFAELTKLRTENSELQRRVKEQPIATRPRTWRQTRDEAERGLDENVA